MPAVTAKTVSFVVAASSRPPAAGPTKRPTLSTVVKPNFPPVNARRVRGEGGGLGDCAPPQVGVLEGGSGRWARLPERLAEGSRRLPIVKGFTFPRKTGKI